MTCTVILRREEDGEEREIPQDVEWDEIEGLWTEGNYACDCNRALFFYDWGPEAEDRECGDTAFSLPRVILGNGTTVEVETEVTALSETPS